MVAIALTSKLFWACIREPVRVAVLDRLDTIEWLVTVAGGENPAEIRVASRGLGQQHRAVPLMDQFRPQDRLQSGLPRDVGKADGAI